MRVNFWSMPQPARPCPGARGGERGAVGNRAIVCTLVGLDVEEGDEGLGPFVRVVWPDK